MAWTERPTTSDVVSGSTSPAWWNRSEHNRVPCVSSNMTDASQPCGRCGVRQTRNLYSPVTSSSPSANPVAGLVEKSLTLTIAPRSLQTGWADGATASHSLSAPHSSDSKWLKPIQRKRDGSRTLAIAS